MSRRLFSLLALPGFIFLAAATDDYSPTILSITYLDGSIEEIASTTRQACLGATEAIRQGLWRLERPVASASCRPGDLFLSREVCIAGFNCEGSPGAESR